MEVKIVLDLRNLISLLSFLEVSMSSVQDRKFQSRIFNCYKEMEKVFKKAIKRR